MNTLTLTLPFTPPAGQVVAVDVAAEDYLADYAATFHEWVGGVVIKTSPVSGQHDSFTAYFRQLVDAYFALKPIGRALNAPFVMRIDATRSMREPDVQVILHENPGNLTATAMHGPADICIEVVSPESASRDYGDKLIEYEQAGVQEYWIIDPLRQRCQFNRRDETGVFVTIATDSDNYYRTPLLPRLALHVPTLWRDELPDPVEIMQAVQDMLSEK